MRNGHRPYCSIDDVAPGRRVPATRRTQKIQPYDASEFTLKNRILRSRVEIGWDVDSACAASQPDWQDWEGVGRAVSRVEELVIVVDDGWHSFSEPQLRRAGFIGFDEEEVRHVDPLEPCLFCHRDSV